MTDRWANADAIANRSAVFARVKKRVLLELDHETVNDALLLDKEAVYRIREDEIGRDK